MPDNPRKVILLIESSSECGRNLIRGIVNYSSLHKPWAFFLEPLSYKEITERKNTLAWIKEIDADGIIVRDLEKVEQIAALGKPVIVGSTVKKGVSNLPMIVTDSELIGKMGADHFIERGFRDFAYCGYDDMAWSLKRSESFAARVTEFGLRIHLYQQPRGKTQRIWQKEQNRLAAWLESLPKPVGIMTCCDYRGQQVMEACKLARIHVPEEAAVLGVDNDEVICNLFLPPLSSIDINFEKAGYEAAELLERLMAGEKMNSQKIIALPRQIVTRQSTDILAMEDAEVAKAVRYIRQHSGEMIQVPDVVEATTLSRRCLLDRFRMVLGRSIHEEITRLRIDKISRLLLETNLSVSQIAVHLGYTGDDHLARYFKKETGMTPLIFRKRFNTK
jgi:LacI family transcriptional regulator